jgi:mono/diheme cytochrome c family protein/glucose/arabinose dehydrogenase
MMLKKGFYFLLIIACCGACGTGSGSGNALKDSLAIREEFSSSPVLSPEESLKHMQVEEGFTVQLAAAEPLVVAPVAMTFDERSRAWVVEMQGYMPDTAGTGEDMATGKIVILDDTDHDGVFDTRKVFLDSLVLPRALCLIENGVLVAEPPRLWYVERNGDTAGKKILVDEKFAEGGNVEHQPIGLLRNIDNWIYNAKSAYRYKKVGSKWLKEKTHFRGQWGLSNDDYGRLFYNNNSANVLGDYFFPSLGANNKNLKKTRGFDETIVADNRVYPARATTGVNRGYMKGFLDSNLRLVNFTAACGPLIYRGDLFGDAYYGNAFVPEPAANLVKRNILEEKGYVVSGKQAYQGKEFLASTDERFRPVNIYTGPDGALYLLDMYRGIIQHKTYLTDYLKNEIRERHLAKPLSCGRIYRIVPANKKAAPVVLPVEPAQLVKLLEHPNGWLREKAQQLIVDKKMVSVMPALRQYLTAYDKPLALIHAMWTLQELGGLKPADIQLLLQHPEHNIRLEALWVLQEAMDKNNYRAFIPVLKQILQQDSLAAPVVVYLADRIRTFDKAAAETLLTTAVKNYADNKYVTDAVLSNLQGREKEFLKTAAAFHTDTSLVFYRRINKVLADITRSKNEANFKELAKKYPDGVAVFKSVCQTCHGSDGNGMTSLAPPLNRSEWVNGDKDKLLSIVLFGLTGPVQVNDKLYKAPEISGDMPGIGNNKELSDEEIAQLLSFIRNAWGNKASEVLPTDVDRVRRKHAGRQKTFTMEELEKMK